MESTSRNLIAAARLEIKEAIGLLKLYGHDRDANLLSLDLIRAGDDYRKILMVRDDAERSLEAASLDQGDVLE